MKSHEEIKKAYFKMLDNSYMMDSYERLVKGYGWMVENGYKDDVKKYCEENGLECVREIIARRYYNNPMKETRMAAVHAAYCETMEVRYNQSTRQYENI